MKLVKGRLLIVPTLVFSALFLSLTLKQQPKLNHPKYINDFEGVFTMTEKQKLDSLSTTIENETTMEIVVVTLDSTMCNKNNFDSTTLVLSNKWGVGKKGKDNGILIGFSKSIRRIRIENGYGIEKRISDYQTKQIIDSLIVPQFKIGNYYEGVRKGMLALYSKLK